MDYWIENGELLQWMDGRQIQSRRIANGVIDGDLNRSTGEWLVVKSGGLVESLSSHLQIPQRVFSRDGVRARWSGDSVHVQETDGRTRIYDSRGFHIRTL